LQYSEEESQNSWYDLLEPFDRIRTWLLFFALLSFASAIFVGISVLVITDFINLHQLFNRGVTVQNLVFTLIVAAFTTYICWMVGLKLFKAARLIFKAKESNYFLHLKDGVEQLRSAIFFFGIGVIGELVFYTLSLFRIFVLLKLG
jgi:hypothetical protein